MKFVILGALRSGTHLLGTLLNSHSQLTCYDECFAYNPELVLKQKPMKEIKDNEGFILLYNHLLNRMDNKRKKMLLNEFTILQMVRNDIDKHALSLYYLNKDDNIPTHSKENTNINYDEGIDISKQKQLIQRRHKQVNNYLHTNKKAKLTISYEWMTHGGKNINVLDKDISIMICDYLKIKREKLTTELKKINANK